MLFGHGTPGNLITLKERKSRFIVGIKNKTKQAEPTANKIIKALRRLSVPVKSLTFDNGKEFYQHERVGASLSAKTYFFEPYKSFQKGSVENGNKLIREYFPTGHSILECSDKLIKGCLKKINARPMKCLDYLSPAETFKQACRNWC